MHLLTATTVAPRFPPTRMAVNEVGEALSTAATGAVDIAADAVGTVAGAVDAALPIVKGAAQLGLGAASFGLEVTSKTLEVAGPVVIESSKVVAPAVAGGFRTLSYGIEHGDLAVQPTPIDLGEMVTSPLAVALANAAPWVIGLFVIYFAGQFAIQSAKDAMDHAIASLVPPTVAVLSAGAALTIAFKTGYIVLDPTPFAFAAVGALILMLPLPIQRAAKVASVEVDEAEGAGVARPGQVASNIVPKPSTVKKADESSRVN
jgi:hypothetical protein